MKGDLNLEQFDLRTLEHHLRSGALTKKEYESYLKKLPDSKSNAEFIEITEEKGKEEKTSGLTFAPAELK